MMRKPYSKPPIDALKSFGLAFGGVLAVLFGIGVPLLRHSGAIGWPWASGNWPAWPWLAGAAVAAWALVHPASLSLLHRPWMRFATIAQWVNTRIIMLFLFYVIILPTGLLLRLFGKDAMQRRLDEKAPSYRVAAEQRDREHMEKPY